MTSMTSLQHIAVEIVLGLALLIGAVLYLEHRGAEKCINADKAAVTKQVAHNEAKGEQDAQTINLEAQTFKNVVAAPEPIDAPHVSLCHYTPSFVPGPKAAGPVPHAAAPSGSEDTGNPKRDVGPPLVKAGQVSDAQVLALQDYISRVCLVR